MSKPKSIMAFLKVFVLCALTFAVSVTTVLSIFGSFDKLSFVCNLCAQFKCQYLWAQLIALCLFALYRYWKTAAFVGLTAVLNVVPVLLLYFPADVRHVAASSEHKMTLLQFNAYYKNCSYDDILAYCRKVNPDVILVEELTPALADFMEQKLSDYPYKKMQPQSDPFGIGVFSKVRIADGQIMDFGQIGNPSVVCSLDLDGKQITLIGTHTMTPTTMWGFKQQNKELGAISKFCQEVKGSTIIAGDLNTTSFTTRFSSLLTENNLYDTRRGFGIESSWPNPDSYNEKVSVNHSKTLEPNVLDRLFMISIDHCLASKDLFTLKHSVGQSLGSDHYPVFTEFAWNADKDLKGEAHERMSDKSASPSQIAEANAFIGR